MSWSVLLPALIAALAALIGVYYGSHLTERRETTNWTREQRLKAYSDLLSSVEECYGAFTLLAAHFKLHNYAPPGGRADPRVRKMVSDWGKGYAGIEEHLAMAQLVCSNEIHLTIAIEIRHGVSGRQQFALMKLDYLGEIDPEEWKAVDSATHGALLRVRDQLRADIYRVERPVSRIHRFRQRLGRRLRHPRVRHQR